MSGALPARTSCPVCGDELQGSCWVCPRCETPHHDDCAEYFGGCAIFGCRDGHPPDPMETRAWPQALSLLRWYVVVRRAQTVALVSFIGGFIAQFLTTRLPPFLQTAWFAAGAAAILAGGLFYLLSDALLIQTLGRRLGTELGPQRAAGLEMSPSRTRAAIPRLDVESVAFHWLRGLAVLVIGVGVVGAVLLDWKYLGIAFPGLVLLTAALQLKTHESEIQLLLHRFEVSYAPRLGKGSDGPAKIGSGSKE